MMNITELNAAFAKVSALNPIASDDEKTARGQLLQLTIDQNLLLYSPDCLDILKYLDLDEQPKVVDIWIAQCEDVRLLHQSSKC
jgi:hypothetical protein